MSLSLLEDLNRERKVAESRDCSFCRWLDTQEPEIVNEVERWILDGLPKKKLWQISVKNGFEASEGSVRRHIDHFNEDRGF